MCKLLLIIMSLTFSTLNHNYKLSFSKNELYQILTCYSLGVSRGYWKDYSINYNKNEASFSIYKHSSAFPLYSIIKYKKRKSHKYYFKIKESRHNNKPIYKFNDVISFLNRKNIKVIK